MTHQCPDCRLKFRFGTELNQHLTLDHPAFSCEPKTVEDALMMDWRKLNRRPRGGWRAAIHERCDGIVQRWTMEAPLQFASKAKQILESIGDTTAPATS